MIWILLLIILPNLNKADVENMDLLSAAILKLEKSDLNSHEITSDCLNSLLRAVDMIFLDVNPMSKQFRQLDKPTTTTTTSTTTTPRPSIQGRTQIVAPPLADETMWFFNQGNCWPCLLEDQGRLVCPNDQLFSSFPECTSIHAESVQANSNGSETN